MSMTPTKLSLSFSHAPSAKGCGGLTESSDVAVLAEIENASNLEPLTKWELEPPFVFISQGHVPPARPWVHRPVTLEGFVIKW